MIRTASVVCCVLLLGLSGCSSPCENEIVKEVVGPSGLRAVVFVRNCGATSDFVASVSILSKEERLPNDNGNVFNDFDGSRQHYHLSDQGALDVRVGWDGPSRLVISYPWAISVDTQSTFRGVVVSYEPRYDPLEDGGGGPAETQ